MTVLNAAELSRLARIAANPRLAREDRAEALRHLQGPAREVARILLGEVRKPSQEAANTATVLRSWGSGNNKK